MKKTISIALVLVMCLSLCACGGQNAETAHAMEMYNKYASVINSMENGDLEGSAMELQILAEKMGLLPDKGESSDIQEKPTDEEWEMLDEYSGIVRRLTDYTDVCSVYYYDNNNGNSLDYKGHEALAYFYTRLQELECIDKWLREDNPYISEDIDPDRKGLLARFTELPENVIKITEETEDNMGNVTKETIKAFCYEAEGRPAIAAALENWNIFTTVPYWGHGRIEYNPEGLIVKITVGSEDRIKAILTPFYDADGKMISCQIKENAGQFSNTYHYDATGHLTKAEIYAGSGVMGSHTYAYNDKGQLVQETQDSLDDLKKSYTYDKNGNLAEIHCTYYYPGGNEIYWEEHQTVTTDEQGRIQSISFTAIDEDSPLRYAKKTQTYVYGPIYLFDGK